MKAGVERIAELCHEVNRIYCESLGDMSQSAWKDAPEWQVQSIRKGVLFHLSNRDAGPSASHDSWLAEKLDTGWVFGEVKDAELKTHPCIMPYEDLPEEQRRKDELFTTIVGILR